MIRSAKRLLGALPFAALPLVTNIASAPAPRVDGYVIAMTVSAQATGMPPMQLTLKAAGAKLRIDADVSAMVGADGAMMAGAFMLPQDDGRIAMILPNMQNPFGGGTGMGMIMDVQSMSGAMRDLGVSLDITDMKVELVNLGAGETILGRKTTRYKLTQKYLMDGKPYEGVSEIWTTTELSDADVGLKKFQETFGMTFIGAATSNEVKAELLAKTPPGFAVRAVVSMTTPDGPQKATIETTKIEKASIDEKDFEVPAGIQLMDMGALVKRGH